MLECNRCKGTGITVLEAFTSSFDGKSYPRTERPCGYCYGAGEFLAPSFKEILDLILSARGKNKGKVKTARPEFARTILADRAYYVWRMARFHGGADVTMPMAASMNVRGDPYRDELDTMADAVARASFGTDLAAANRWGSALGLIPRDLPGLPATAYSGGPVHDGNKPDEELAELL